MIRGRISARDFLGLGRFHLVAMAGLLAVVTGWLLEGRFGLVAGGLAAFDWFLFNLMNRISDVPEDLRNGVSGAGFVEQNAGALMRVAFLALAVSLVGARPLGTPLLVLRAAFHLGGFAYSFPTVGRRLKEVFLLKNVCFGLLFVGSVVGYPLALAATAKPLPELLALCAFLLPLAITYALIYDLRDVAGDAALGIVTLPIRWGEKRTRAVIDLLLALSATALLAGYLAGALRWRELVMIAAPLQQALAVRLWMPRSVGKREAAGITWLGAAQCLGYLAWVRLGLPLERPW